MNPVVQALALLTPYDIDRPKIRRGPATDGGYVFVDDISPDQAIVSYGISTEYSFDAEMAERGHDVYMFDHTIAGIHGTSNRMYFFREGVAGVTDPSASLYTIEDHLTRHRIAGDRLILKMDVEGAEFAALNALPECVLERFEQIVLEVHGLHQMEDFTYREKFCAVFRKLNRLFTLFHVHANNFDGPNGLHIVSGLPVSNLLELSYVRTGRVKSFPSRTLYPTSFDYPNVPKKDKLLWFFPFLPTSVGLESFAACEELVDLRHRGNGHDQGARPAGGPVLINVALGKPASQSSASKWSAVDEAARAVSGTIPKDLAFHTDIEDRPWWQVDLLESIPIEKIVVHNRLDALQERARTLVVEVSDDAMGWVVVHSGFAMFSGGHVGAPLELRLGGEVSGRYVRLSLAERQWLHLSQVEVLARPEMVAFERFRRRHGLEALKPGTRPPMQIPEYFVVSGSNGGADPYKMAEKPIVGLKVNLMGRLGNLVVQYTTAVIFARRTGLKYIQMFDHELSAIDTPFSVGDITFLPSRGPLPEGYWLSGFFFDPVQLAPLLAEDYQTDEAERCRITQEIIRPHLLGSLAPYWCDHDPREVAVHLRAGDVFDKEGYLHIWARQPPLSFYKLVIERLRAAGKIDRVRLVFEDRGNPCIDALGQYLIEQKIPFCEQSGALADDLAALVDAHHLVFGYGTFGYAVCRLSAHVETVHYYEPEQLGCYGAMPCIDRVFAVRDCVGSYIKRGEWRNTPEQRQVMLTYAKEALEIEEVKSPG
jgi:hypothetical protein